MESNLVDDSPAEWGVLDHLAQLVGYTIGAWGGVVGCFGEGAPDFVDGCLVCVSEGCG